MGLKKFGFGRVVSVAQEFLKGIYGDFARVTVAVNHTIANIVTVNYLYHIIIVKLYNNIYNPIV